MNTKLISPQDISKLSAPMITIQSTVTLHDVVEVQLQPNSFHHTPGYGGGSYYHVIDEETCVQVMHREGWLSVTQIAPSYFTAELSRATPCSEADYQQAFQSAILSIHSPFEAKGGVQ